ncbi:MAG: 3-oxoacyl-ACP reductase FabG [Gammaproteobacteria bacterium]|nr:3-oxoacyl-ACP reductase FabG [Gammaproteobacteria bacterium]NIM73086.1 3-oxoacyl-ACP reductase FabG [Gammaproteobacteria bacterium]NIN38703.1 3-oxoacyl-ACP reductase FabG [Gammaproteobacteria bacterium]NIO24839.1 3-oxoacyl-ACP reductase FabG [Gammaproteobacteria bacterium]NIO65442.1 3-oxoacyl-ACP reductase FabG [Gammaproteobacteria bacterium]
MTRALVTGASGGIGSAICRRLAADGLEVIVHANRNVERARAIVEEIQAAGGRAEVAVFDVTDAERTQECVKTLCADEAVQVLVNNAGIHLDAPMAGMSRAQWSEVIDVSLNGFFNVTHPLLMPMIRTRWGRIVNITSVSAALGPRGQANYAAAKAGVQGATRSLARELASRGITVNAVAPGIIAGDMADGVFDANQIEALVPMKRAGHADEVAAVVAFLVSDAASYLSGQIIGVNGAMI